MTVLPSPTTPLRRLADLRQEAVEERRTAPDKRAKLTADLRVQAIDGCIAAQQLRISERRWS